MPTEVWFRNPDNYVRELVEVAEGRVAWDRGYLVKKSIDPDKHASLYYGRATPWQALVIGEQGTAHLDADHPLDKPLAVYPTWRYGEAASLLEEIVAHPVGEDQDICFDLSVAPDERPVMGQPHRVVVTDLPDSKTGMGRSFLRFLKELQEDYPQCIIHVHGLYSFRMAFGLGFKSADYDPRTLAQKGKIVLPSGKEEKFEKAAANPQWVQATGFKPVDLKIPRNRCIFNIKSAQWAGEHYEQLYRFKTGGATKDVDLTSSDADFKPEETKSHMSVPVKPKQGDQFHCDTCSLQTQCKYFRTGAVCSVPGAEPTELAKFFKTRDSGLIIEGLGTIVAAQTRRLDKAMAEEDFLGELDPNVTKLLNSIFDQGVKLAKLVDPSLRGGVNVNVGVGPGGQAAISFNDPREMVASVIRSFELQGIPRNEITTDMIKGVVEGMNDPDRKQQAIEGTVVERRESA